jgi:abortive infection bacteriophage resistance protein
MGKKATSVKEQIDKLIGRGLIMDWGKEKAEEILLDIGYYRLGFYWNPFEIDDQHNFEKGTKFSDIVYLYYLDTDLKFILSKAINRIEINLKTQIIYYVSNYYDKNPTWFADKKIVTNDFVDGFKNTYTQKFINNNKPIKKHHNKYTNDIYAPAWKTIEFLTFGSVVTLFLSLQNTSLKNKISAQYNIQNLKIFENYILTILFIRNICAHSDLLFDSYTEKGIKSSPMVKIEANNRHSLSSSIKVICYFLSQISKNRADEISNEIDKVLKSFGNNKVINNIIAQKIGDPFV